MQASQGEPERIRLLCSEVKRLTSQQAGTSGSPDVVSDQSEGQQRQLGESPMPKFAKWLGRPVKAEVTSSRANSESGIVAPLSCSDANSESTGPVSRRIPCDISKSQFRAKC